MGKSRNNNRYHLLLFGSYVPVVLFLIIQIFESFISQIKTIHDGIILVNTQSNLHTCKGKEFFFEMDVKFVTTVDQDKCLKQIKLPISLYQ